MNKKKIKSALIITGEDWEVMYINGESVDQGHTINEGTERYVYILGMLMEHGINPLDISFAYTNDKGDKMLEELGRFPDELSDFEGCYGISHY